MNKNFRLKTLTLIVFSVSFSTAAAAAKSSERLSSLESDFNAMLSSIQTTRAEIFTQISAAISQLPDDATDADIRPIVSALSTVAAYDLDNQSGRMAHDMIEKFGEARIKRLISNTSKPAFLMIGLTKVRPDGRDEPED